MEGSCPGSGHGLLTVQAKRCWLSSVLSTGPGGKANFSLCFLQFPRPGLGPFDQNIFFCEACSGRDSNPGPLSPEWNYDALKH